MIENEKKNLLEVAGSVGMGAGGVKIGSELARELLLHQEVYSATSSLICETIGGFVVGAIGAGLGMLSGRLIGKIGNTPKKEEEI